ncbi:hypothetical protein K2X89_05260 [Myxococcota bacterium]|nr:hypothetical protein [Myxococcota bacterium]
MGSGIRTSVAMGGAVILALGLTLTTAGDASAKTGRKRNCATAEAAFQATGAGDLDGDGLSDCRESRQLRTSPTNPDTDGDDLMDGEEVAERSDPLVADSDDDGLMDGEDDSPRIPEQKVEGFLDALTCPSVGVLGSIKVLGTTAILDDVTEFEHETCAELAGMLMAAMTAGEPMLVEVEIAEDALGVMTAIEVERKSHCGEHDDEDDDDDDHEGPGGGEED